MSGLYTVLVTGANAGLGFATCCRIIDEFLATRSQAESLRLIFTTRDQKKSDATLGRLRAHVAKTIRSVYGSTTHDAISARQTARIRLEGQLLDLLSLVSVKRLAQELLSKPDGVHIDALVLNAGIGGWSGLNWPRAVWCNLTGLVTATTWPDYKIGHVGRAVTQSGLGPHPNGSEEPSLGETFTANLFGHYVLCHMLLPALQLDPHAQRTGRIVWLSSIEAQAHSFDPTDLQGLTSNISYESSKRLTDLLVLTSEEPSSKPYIDSFYSSSNATISAEERPRMYVCHPGICATSIAGLALPLHYAMICAMYIARWLGSPWHPIEAYIGAVSSVWLALAPSSVLATLEGRGHKKDGEVADSDARNGKSKWGSSTDRLGNERVLRTDVPGWGWSGIVGDSPDEGMKIKAGRHWAAKDLTADDKREFLDLGRNCWKEMEELRKYWESRL